VFEVDVRRSIEAHVEDGHQLAVDSVGQPRRWPRLDTGGKKDWRLNHSMLSPRFKKFGRWHRILHRHDEWCESNANCARRKARWLFEGSGPGREILTRLGARFRLGEMVIGGPNTGQMVLTPEFRDLGG
jgi:hypothetical protein